MKKILFSIATLSLLMTSCVDESNDYNNDHAKAYSVPAGTLLTDAEKEIADQMTTPNVNLNVFRMFSQYWAETQYTTESKYRVTTRKIPDNHWNNLFRDALGNLESAKTAVNSEVQTADISVSDWNIQQKNKLAIIEILEVYTYQILVDSFGDIPYTEALDPNIVLPKYDKASDIYPKLITRLNAAIANLNTSGNSFSKGEYIYNGDTTKWSLFANSLKVKLGINLSDFNPALAKSTVESAISGGLITSNSNNANFKYVSTTPNYNPIYDNLVASNRNDFVPTKVFIDDMNTLSDPRRAVYFTMVGGVYSGGKYGYSNSYAVYSHVGDAIKKVNAPATLFEATEVNFLLAEAAARGFSVGDTAENFYNQAIQSSFEFWGLPSSSATTYLADPNVAYATAPGASYKEKIGRQAWIALFNRGFESWTTWRRLDAPNLVAPASAYPEADGEVPKRLPYPVNEQTVNGDSWKAASISIGGDKLKTHIFWDMQ
jgi:hypothetical protein